MTRRGTQEIDLGRNWKLISNDTNTADPGAIMTNSVEYMIEGSGGEWVRFFEVLDSNPNPGSSNKGHLCFTSGTRAQDSEEYYFTARAGLRLFARGSDADMTLSITETR